MKTKILIVEHDSNDMDLIQQELKKGDVNYITETVQTETEYKKAIHIFQPDIILSNYTFPTFDGLTALKIREKLVPQTPFIFVSESINKQNIDAFIKNGVTYFVLKERLHTLIDKMNRVLHETELTKLKEQLKQSEEQRTKDFFQNESKYHSLIESSVDVLCSFDKEGRFVSVNDAAETIWGYKPEELKGLKFIDLVFHEDTKSTLEEDIKVRSGVPVTMFENRYIHKEGHIVPMLWSSRWDEMDQLSYGIAKDATEKKKLEKAFEIERQRFMDLYFQAPSCMGILKGPNHVYEMANPLNLQLIDKKDIIGKTVKEVLPELEAQGIFKFLDTVYQTGETFSANEMLMKFDHHGDGKLVDTYLNLIYQAHRNNDGDIDGILFFGNDVTEQVISRKKIEESENRFRALIEKSEEMIMLTTAEGKLLYGSPSITKVFGYSEEDVSDKFAFEHIHPDDLTEFLKKREKLVATPGKSFYHQQRVLHKNGNWIWCENTVTNMLHEPSINALVTNFRDITEKKIAEQQREFERNNLNALINNTDDLMWSVNKDYSLITSNKPFDDMAKSISGKIIPKGCNILTGITPEQIILFKKFYERAFTGETFTEIVYRKIPFEMWSEISYYPIRKGNEIIGTACHSRNITERKNAEQNLKKQNEELADYKFVLDASSIVGITDKNGIIIYANDNFCKISQYSREELIGQTHRIINSGYHSKAFIQNKWETISSGKTWKGELKNKAKDGTFFWVDTTITPFLDEQGTPYQYVATRFDITARKEAELNLEKQNIELAFQYEEKENRAAELITANKELAFQNEEKENRAAELVIANKELAFQNEEKENRAAELVIANKELAFQNDEKENRAAELIIANHELAFQNEEKENRAAELVIANHELEFQNEEKENRATELIITNNELIKTNTELDRFVYSVSHDLRSPLTSVLGLISFIEEESEETDTLEHVKMIRNSINRLDEFIKNILSYSRNNRTGLQVEKISIQKKALAIVNSLQSMNEAKGIHYEIDIKEEQPFYSDLLRVNTILENLISNAIKYHTKEESGRYIKITGQSDREKLQLTIADNGIGIAPAYHDKIFDMFFRLSGKTDGSGIGLYIVKDTVEILQGSIEIQSEKGIGTTFIITLKNLKP